MRISERKTPAAVLRFIIGEKLDDDFLKLAGCSAGLWKKLENGDRKMTEARAATLEARTGISKAWLLGGSTRKPVTYAGEPFTRETFLAHLQGVGGRAGVSAIVCPGGFWPQLMAIAEAANASGNLAGFAVDLKASVKTLQKNYGFDRRVFEDALIHARKHPEAFAPFVGDGAVSDEGRVERFKENIRIIRQGGMPTIGQEKRAYIDKLDPLFTAKPDEMEVQETVVPLAGGGTETTRELVLKHPLAGQQRAKRTQRKHAAKKARR